MKKIEHAKTLIERALKHIPNLPEVFNLTKRDNWTFNVELKDETGTRYEAEVRYNPTRDETSEDGFAVLTVLIGTGRWFFRAFREGEEEHVVYVGSATPQPLPSPWYEGHPFDSEGYTTNKCTSCRKRRSSVKQAYWGGYAIEEVARCAECQKLPCSAIQPLLTVLSFSPQQVPSLEQSEP